MVDGSIPLGEGIIDGLTYYTLIITYENKEFFT